MKQIEAKTADRSDIQTTDSAWNLYPGFVAKNGGSRKRDRKGGNPLEGTRER